MAVTTPNRRPAARDDVARRARRRETIEGLLILGVLVVLAILARLPSA
jgi:hypothetical protein